MYFVCPTHNKVKIGEVWFKLQTPLDKWLLKMEMRSVAQNTEPPKMVVTACDECEYPYFG